MVLNLSFVGCADFLGGRYILVQFMRSRLLRSFMVRIIPKRTSQAAHQVHTYIEVHLTLGGKQSIRSAEQFPDDFDGVLVVHLILKSHLIPGRSRI